MSVIEPMLFTFQEPVWLGIYRGLPVPLRKEIRLSDCFESLMKSGFSQLNQRFTS